MFWYCTSLNCNILVHKGIPHKTSPTSQIPQDNDITWDQALFLKMGWRERGEKWREDRGGGREERMRPPLLHSPLGQFTPGKFLLKMSCSSQTLLARAFRADNHHKHGWVLAVCLAPSLKIWLEFCWSCKQTSYMYKFQMLSQFSQKQQHFHISNWKLVQKLSQWRFNFAWTKLT